MRRRDFIALLGGVFSWPFAAHAQQRAMPVIGQLSVFSPPANLGDLVRGPIHQGMREMGFVEGQNMTWEYRWAEFETWRNTCNLQLDTNHDQHNCPIPCTRHRSMGR
jgi:hypothetical protein